MSNVWVCDSGSGPRGTIASPASTYAEAWQSVECSSRKQSVHAVVHSGRLELKRSMTSDSLKVENCSGVEFADLQSFVPEGSPDTLLFLHLSEVHWTAVSVLRWVPPWILAFQPQGDLSSRSSPPKMLGVFSLRFRMHKFMPCCPLHVRNSCRKRHRKIWFTPLTKYGRRVSLKWLSPLSASLGRVLSSMGL